MRTPDPVIPVRLLASPVIWRSNLVVVCFAAALFGSVLYLPLYLQLGRGFGIGASGLLLLPITLVARRIVDADRPEHRPHRAG